MAWWLPQRTDWILMDTILEYVYELHTSRAGKQEELMAAQRTGSSHLVSSLSSYAAEDRGPERGERAGVTAHL